MAADRGLPGFAPETIRPEGTPAVSAVGHGARAVARSKHEADLTADQLLFLDWLTGDKPFGESQNQFGDRIGVAGYNLAKWKRNVTFQLAWQGRLMDTHAHPEILSNQLASIREIIDSPKSHESSRLKAVELYWKLLEKMAPQGKIVPEAAPAAEVDQLTDEQLEAELAQVTPLRSAQ